MTVANKNILVTGAGGFIGSHLCEQLVREGAKVTAFLRYTSGRTAGLLDLIPEEVRENIEIIFGDLRDRNAIYNAVAKKDIVFHLGALVGIPYSYAHFNEVIDTNIQGTVNILDAAKNHGALLLQTSTSEVYGSALTVPITEDHPRQPQSPYSATKVSADALVYSFIKSFGLRAIVVRPFNNYGPRQSGRAVIPTIIAQALYSDSVQLGILDSTRDFNYVTDTANAFVLLASTPKAIGETFNVGFGQEITIGNLARKILKQLNKDLPIEQISERVRPDASEVNRLYADATKLKEYTGWEPKIGLDLGLSNVIEFITEHPTWIDTKEYII